MAGLDPAIHVSRNRAVKDVDPRQWPGTKESEEKTCGCLRTGVPPAVKVLAQGKPRLAVSRTGNEPTGKSFQLAFLARNAHIAIGRLARDVSLANRVRSGRKQP